ncbi:MAG: TadE/TadG family type IV pilus assembly protein [Acidobacteriota bacterium]
MMEAIRKRLRRHTGDSGQALAELCVGLGLLVLIVLGAIEFGQVAYTSIEVANAAKAGVQYGSQDNNTAVDATGIQNAAAAAAPNLTGLSTSVLNSCICSDGTASTCLNTDCPNSHLEDTVTVSTSYTFTPIVDMPAFPSSFTLKGQASQKCGQ